jgi:CheY-like chemotaxis protein
VKHAGKSVLIVEDAADIQYLLEALLRAEGYIVNSVNNGREALDLLNTSGKLPGLIILDLMMPVMDGYDFRREQEKNPKFAAIPVIVMTADGDYQAKSMRVGARGFLKKPFENLEEILGKVAQHCLPPT